MRVAPFMGAWIETLSASSSLFFAIRLLPLWEHGLKHAERHRNYRSINVAPFMGAWIETLQSQGLQRTSRVAPFMGAWIETSLLNRTE